MLPGQTTPVPSSLVSEEECEKIADEVYALYGHGGNGGVPHIVLRVAVRYILTAERERAKRFRASVLLEAAQLVKEAKDLPVIVDQGILAEQIVQERIGWLVCKDSRGQPLRDGNGAYVLTPAGKRFNELVNELVEDGVYDVRKQARAAEVILMREFAQSLPPQAKTGSDHAA